jgi:hypothetical protein
MERERLTPRLVDAFDGRNDELPRIVGSYHTLGVGGWREVFR